MEIRRILYGIVRNGDEILVGTKSEKKFLPFGKVKARNKICLYESEAKAMASVRFWVYLPGLMAGKNDRITVQAFEETLEAKGDEDESDL